MKPRSISGIVFYVQDTEKSAKFYEALGFRPGKDTSGVLAMYLNWFWVELRPAEQPVDNTGGSVTYVSVDDTGKYYQHIVSQGFTPEGEPATALGRREFILKDPDGYRLAFFQKV